MFEFAKKSAMFLIITGSTAVIFGIVALAWPLTTVLTLVLIWSWYAIIDGILGLIAAFRPENRPARMLLLFTGIIGVGAGLLVAFRPFEASLALTWILGIWLVVRGATSMFSGFANTLSTPRWLLILSSLLFIVAGIIFIANPGSAVLAVSRLLGFLTISAGLLTLGGGLALRWQAKEAKTAASTLT